MAKYTSNTNTTETCDTYGMNSGIFFYRTKTQTFRFYQNLVTSNVISTQRHSRGIFFTKTLKFDSYQYFAIFNVMSNQRRRKGIYLYITKTLNLGSYQKLHPLTCYRINDIEYFFSNLRYTKVIVSQFFLTFTFQKTDHQILEKR